MAAIVAGAQVFFLVFARVTAMVETSPLLSSDAIPQIGKIGLAFFVSFVVFPWIHEAGYPLPSDGLHYALLVLGEAMVGLIIGFFLTLIYSGFQAAGQFFSLQMGFGATEVFDPLAQIEIPTLGQFLNLIAMFIFLVVGGFQKLMLIGVYRSFRTFRAVDLVVLREDIVTMLLQGLSGLFAQALAISFPIVAVLFLVSVSMGLLAKAAPQMNLLMMGFPLAIGVAFIVMFAVLPAMGEVFARIIDGSFETLARLLNAGGGPR